MEQVESWLFYDEMARSGEFGEIVTPAGELRLHAWHRTTGEFFIRVLQGRRSVIDLGCGLGFPALILAPHVERLTAVDGAPAMVEGTTRNARRLGCENIEVVCADVTALPLPSCRFDGASICGTMGSVSDPDAMLAELQRVMKPGGVVACIAENFADKLTKEKWHHYWFRSDGGVLSFQSIEYLQQPYRIRDTRYLIRPQSEISQRLAAKHNVADTWREETEKGPEQLAREDIERVIFDETVQFDPDTLSAAFRNAGFRLESLEINRSFRVECIFAAYRKD